MKDIPFLFFFVSLETAIQIVSSIERIEAIRSRIEDEYRVDVRAEFIYINGLNGLNVTLDESCLVRLFDEGVGLYLTSPMGVWEEPVCIKPTLLESFEEINKQLRPLEDLVQHVVDESHGIYSAQEFCQRFETELKTVLLSDDQMIDLDIVLKGPEMEGYYDAWEFFDTITINIDGIEWRIYENQGIFLIRDDLTELEEELVYASFY